MLDDDAPAAATVAAADAADATGDLDASGALTVEVPPLSIGALLEQRHRKEMQFRVQMDNTDRRFVFHKPLDTEDVQVGRSVFFRACSGLVPFFLPTPAQWVTAS